LIICTSFATDVFSDGEDALDVRDSEVQFQTGLIYGNGEGMPEDDKEAMARYRLAAEQGHARAKNNLAQLLLNNKP